MVSRTLGLVLVQELMATRMEVIGYFELFVLFGFGNCDVGLALECVGVLLSVLELNCLSDLNDYSG